MPPSRAIAIAIRLSVTVSIAALISGALSSISRVSRVVVSMSLGRQLGEPRQQQDVVVGEPHRGEHLGRAPTPGILPATPDAYSAARRRSRQPRARRVGAK